MADVYAIQSAPIDGVLDNHFDHHDNISRNLLKKQGKANYTHQEYPKMVYSKDDEGNVVNTVVPHKKAHDELEGSWVENRAELQDKKKKAKPVSKTSAVVDNDPNRPEGDQPEYQG